MERSRPKFGPIESQQAFIRFIYENDGVTPEEALTFEDFENYWFGPGIDAMDIIEKLMTFEIVEVDHNEGKFKISESHRRKLNEASGIPTGNS